MNQFRRRSYLGVCIAVIAVCITLSHLHAQEAQSSGLGFRRVGKGYTAPPTRVTIPTEGSLTLPPRFILSADIELVPKETWGQILSFDSPELTLFLSVRHHFDAESTTIELSVNKKSAGSVTFPKRMFQRNQWHHCDISVEETVVTAGWNSTSFARMRVQVLTPLQATMTIGSIPPINDGFNGGMRDLRITTTSLAGTHSILHEWPMEARNGDGVRDIARHRDGRQEHGTWLSREHEQWVVLNEIPSLPVTGVAFDPRTARVMIPLKDSLIVFDCSAEHLSAERYRTPRPSEGVLAYFDVHDRKLRIYHGGAEGQISVYDQLTRTWSAIDARGDREQHFYVHTALGLYEGRWFTYGGYGWYRLRNEVRQYDFVSKQWANIPMQGDSIEPRSHAVLASEEAPGRFLVFGGYGVASGRQSDLPHPVPEMFRIDVPSRTMTRLWRYPDSSFCTLTSSAPSQDGRLFYFSKGLHHDTSDRAIFAGRVDTPMVWKIGGGRNMSGTFSHVFNRDDQELILVTWGGPGEPVHADVRTSTVRIFRLRLPATPTENIQEDSAEPVMSRSVVAGLAAASVLIAGTYLAWFRRRGRGATPAPPVENVPQIIIRSEHTPKNRNSIYLFGSCDVFDRGGELLREGFSPLLKEMLALLLVRSRPAAKVKGIERSELSEVFWPMYDEKSSKNNRGVALSRLRGVVARLDGLHLNHTGALWTIRTEPPCECDLFVLDELATMLKAPNIWDAPDVVRQAATIAGRGRLLAGLSYAWLDGIRTDLEISLVRCLVDVLRRTPSNAPAGMVIDLACAVLTHESTNVDAVVMKLRMLLQQGHSALAREVADEFRRTYEAERGKPFEGQLPGGQ